MLIQEQLRASSVGLKNWVLANYPGRDVKDCIARQAESLVTKAQVSKPPVSLYRLAKTRGIDPWPIYENLKSGGLKIVNGELRVILRRPTSYSVKSRTLDRRSRFTYAHELGHTLFYDLTQSPPTRRAPLCYKLEEQLCNIAASLFLMPDILINTIFQTPRSCSYEFLCNLANEYEVSLQAITYRLESAISRRLCGDRFFMLSGNAQGLGGVCVIKPRCIACVLSSKLLSQKISFLRSYQSVDRIHRRVRNCLVSWSLDEFFKNGLDKQQGASISMTELVETPGGVLLELDISHTTERAGGVVWTSGTMKTP